MSLSLWKPKVHYRGDKSPLFAFLLSQINSVYVPSFLLLSSCVYKRMQVII